MNIYQLEYKPQHMNAVNFAALHKLKGFGVDYLGQYVFTPDKPLESSDSDSPSSSKPKKNAFQKFFISIGQGLTNFGSKVKNSINGTADPATEYKKDNSILNDPKKSQPSFLTPEKELQEGMRTLFHLYKYKEQTFAVFNPTTNPAQTIEGQTVFGRKHCIPVDYALNMFFKKYELNDPDYVFPDVLLVPVSWRDLHDEDDAFEWSLLKITPPANYSKSASSNIDISETEIVMYIDRDNEAHRKSMRSALKEFSTLKTIIDEDENKTVNGPRWADDFNLSAATTTPDGGPWVNKNIRSIIVGSEPESTHKLDIREQYSNYYEWLGYKRTGKFLKQKPISAWNHYRTTVLIIGAILLLAVIVGAFSLGFPGAFAGLIYGLGAMFHISATAIGALTVAQTALITASFVATLATLIVAVGALFRAGIVYLVTRKTKSDEQAAEKLKDYQQSSNSTTNEATPAIPPVQETMRNVQSPSATPTSVPEKNNQKQDDDLTEENLAKNAM